MFARLGALVTGTGGDSKPPAAPEFTEPVAAIEQRPLAAPESDDVVDGRAGSAGEAHPHRKHSPGASPEPALEDEPVSGSARDPKPEPPSVPGPEISVDSRPEWPAPAASVTKTEHARPPKAAPARKAKTTQAHPPKMKAVSTAKTMPVRSSEAGPVPESREASVAKPAPTPLVAAAEPAGPSDHEAQRAPEASRADRRSWIPALVIVPVVGATAALLAINNASIPPAGTAVSAAPAISDASGWIAGNASRDERLAVDGAMEDELVGAGWDPSDVLAYGELSNWRDVQYVVTAPVAGTSADDAQLAIAIANSIVVASFGDGDELVEVRMVTPGGAVLATAAQTRAAEARAEFGGELASNPSILLSDADQAILEAGRVDSRIVFVLAALAAGGEVAVTGFPIVDGEQSGPIRQVALSDIGGTPLSSGGALTPEAQDAVGRLTGLYAPSDATVDGTSLILRYDPAIDPLAE